MVLARTRNLNKALPSLSGEKEIYLIFCRLVSLALINSELKKYNNELKNDVDNRSVLGTENMIFFAITNTEKIFVTL